MSDKCKKWECRNSVLCSHIAPSPKPCCDLHCGRKECPCVSQIRHQSKPEHTHITRNFVEGCPACFPPEVSPGKEDKCNICDFKVHMHPTPPAKEEVCDCGSGFKVWHKTECSSISAPAKEEKEVCKQDHAHCSCSNVLGNCTAPHDYNCPGLSTLTEQKGEWEIELHSWLTHNTTFTPHGVDKALELVAAKKKEWEAQKEQAVKAEIREACCNACKNKLQLGNERNKGNSGTADNSERI